MRARLATALAATMRRRLALISEAVLHRAHQMRCGVAVVAVIARLFARHEHVPGVVIVVVPLRAVMAGGRLLARIENAGAVLVVLEHEMDEPPALTREG